MNDLSIESFADFGEKLKQKDYYEKYVKHYFSGGERQKEKGIDIFDYPNYRKL